MGRFFGRFFDVLNRPIAVLVVLFVVVALNSFAFFYFVRDPSPEAPATPPADRGGLQTTAARMASGNASSPSGEKVRWEGISLAGEHNKPAQPEHADTDLAQQQDSGVKQRQATPQDEQATYVDEVGEIQDNSVDAFLDSHEKLLRYDALTSDDIEKMQANQAALKKSVDRASTLSASQKYREHKDVFRPAIDELHQAAQLAYVLAADPISATQADFEHYDHLVDKAAVNLQRSNEILGKDHKTIEGVKGVSTPQ
jgi:LAS superfamily LD-carboxypeptidase LdcB